MKISDIEIRFIVTLVTRRQNLLALATNRKTAASEAAVLL